LPPPFCTTEGVLDLDAPVQRYVPAYRQTMDGHHAPVDGRRRGRHRIRGDNNDAMPVEHCASLDEAVALFAGDPLLFEPGTTPLLRSTAGFW
jgi:hypothetical protein